MTSSQRFTRIMFIHIPKAAGTSFRESAADVFGSSQVFWYGHRRPETDFFQMTAEELSAYKIVGGHLNGPLLSKAGGAHFFCSILREPISRINSYLRYIMRPEISHPLGKVFNIKDPIASIEQSHALRSELHNNQCWRICGSFRAEDAISYIIERPFLIGDMHSADYVFHTAINTLGGRVVSLRSENLGKKGVYEPEESRSLQDYILEKNNEDIKLYDWIKIKGGKYSSI